jgi:D-serine deaminase-like pyridoxal phosphate-dependent protein
VPIEPGKFAAATVLARQGVRLGLVSDDPEVASALDAHARSAGVRFAVWIDFDCGYGRTGVTPDDPRGDELARRLARASNLDFAGALTHAGHSYGDPEAERIAAEERDRTAEFTARCRDLTGATDLVASVGSTPTYARVDHLRGIDEARPGNYAFFDATQAAYGNCSLDDCALTVLAAVVHRDRSRRRVILDAGAIALSKDRGPVGVDPECGFGRVLDLQGNDLGLRVTSLSQEHGWIDADDDTVTDRLAIGTRVRILANHSCLTAAQHERYHVVEGDRAVDHWPIQGVGTWR